MLVRKIAKNYILGSTIYKLMPVKLAETFSSSKLLLKLIGKTPLTYDSYKFTYKYMNWSKEMVAKWNKLCVHPVWTLKLG